MVWLGLSTLTLFGCQDSGQSPPSRPDAPGGTPATSQPGPVDLVYVCGNKFLVTNANPTPVQVVYRVAGTNESGSLMLPEGPGGDPGYSETELETKTPGVVELYDDDVRVARRINEGSACGAPAIEASVTVAGNEATVGKWAAPFNWPIVALHVHLLRNGKVLA